MQIEAWVSELNEMIDDLRACHRFYCQYNCGTLMKTGALKTHTPRCKKLCEEYGFKPSSHMVESQKE
jgi:hypothetical protein